jgi:hypothetical protein
MRVFGWCTVCRKVKRVTARDVDVALAAMRRGTPVGVCDDCSDHPLNATDP